VPSPNYGFEKRQRELAKKRKKEDKLKAKADRKAGILPAGEESDAEAGEDGLPGTEAANDGAPATPPPAA
jgi:hypothetical protein